MKTTLIYSIFRADSEYHTASKEKYKFSDRNGPKPVRKPIRSELLRNIFKISTGSPRFFLDNFNHFVAFRRGYRTRRNSAWAELEMVTNFSEQCL